MKKTICTFISLLMLMHITLIIPVTAQTFKESNADRLAYIMNPATDIEEFRNEFSDYLAELSSVLERFKSIPAVRQKLLSSNLTSPEMMDDARQSLASSSHSDLVILRNAYAKVPGWRNAPRQLDDIFERVQQRSKIGFSVKGGGGQTDNIIPDNCTTGINAGITNTDISIAEALVIAGDVAMELLPTDAASILLREIVTVARGLLKGLALAAVTLKAIADDCTSLDISAVGDIVNNAKTEIINNDNANSSTIVTNDTVNAALLNVSIATASATIVSNDDTNLTTVLNNNAAQTTTITTAVTNAKTEIVNNDNSNALALNVNVTNTRTAIISNDNTNTSNIVNNDNANRVLITNNDNANTTTLDTAITVAKDAILANANANNLLLTNLMLRTQIEADLAEADSATFVAFYVTPTSQGGHLNFVRSIVVESIAKLGGPNTAEANEFLAIADAAKASGQYKLAYRNYRKAYKKAIGL